MKERRTLSFWSQLGLEGNIRSLALQTLLSQIGFGMFYVIWQPFVLSTGTSVLGLGIVQSVINMSTAVGLITWGILSDKYGRKPVILLSNICRILSVVALLLSNNFTYLLAFAFFMGFSSMFMMSNPARSALISESIGSSRRATAFSTLMSISMISNALTASAGGWLAVTSGYTPIFYICLVGDILGLFILMFFIKETRIMAPEDTGPAEGLLKRFIGFFLPEKGVRRFYAILLIQGFGYGTGLTLLFGTLVDKYGFTELQLGLLSTAFTLTWGISSIPIGRLTDRLGRKPMIMVSWFLMVTSILGFIFSRSFGMFLLFHVVHGLEAGFWFPAWLALVSEKVFSDRRSTVMGKIDAYSMLAGIPAPWLGGLLYSKFGFVAPLAVYLVCVIISAPIVFTLKE
jgi:MFS family permease